MLHNKSRVKLYILNQGKGSTTDNKTNCVCANLRIELGEQIVTGTNTYKCMSYIYTKKRIL